MHKSIACGQLRVIRICDLLRVDQFPAVLLANEQASRREAPVLLAENPA